MTINVNGSRGKQKINTKVIPPYCRNIKHLWYNMVWIYFEGIYKNAEPMEGKKCHFSVHNLKRDGVADFKWGHKRPLRPKT
jgi:hypothetical protein